MKDLIDYMLAVDERLIMFMYMCLKIYVCLFVFVASRLAGGVIKVGDNSNGTLNSVCATVTMEQTDASQLIVLNCSMEGRYLSVELTTASLHFCELKAYPCNGR